MIRSSNRLASSNSFRASFPIFGSSSSSGNFPRSCQTMKKKTQLMYSFISERGKSSNTLIPVKVGF
jgi:hypothetical protein